MSKHIRRDEGRKAFVQSIDAAPHVFGALGNQAKQALIQYFALEEEIWPCPQILKPYVGMRYSENWLDPENLLNQIQLERARAESTSWYYSHPEIKRMRFGVDHRVPRYQIEDALMDHHACVPDDWSSFTEYHEWYMRASIREMVRHTGVEWPLLISPNSSELIVDGFHRFHLYVALKQPVIPVLIFDHRSEEYRLAEDKEKK